MKSKSVTIWGITGGIYFAFSILPFALDIPVFDFILAYFRPYFGWKKIVAMRFFFLSLPFVLRFGELWGYVVNIEVPLMPNPLLLLPTAFLISTLEHFIFLIYFDHMLTKKRVPFRY